MKKNWMIKGKIIYQKETIAKYTSLQRRRDTELKKGSRWYITTKTIYKIVWFYFFIIIFLVGWGNGFNMSNNRFIINKRPKRHKLTFRIYIFIQK